MRNRHEFDSVNNSIATILKKEKLSNNLYQFTYDKVIIGHLDKDKGVFISVDGKEYPSIHSSRFIDNKVSRVYGTYLEKDDLDLVFPRSDANSVSVSVLKYVEYVKSLMYFVKVKKNKNGDYSINIKDVDLNRVVDSFKDFNTNLIISEDDSFVEEVLSNKVQKEDFLNSTYIDNNTFIDNLNELIADVYNCEYNSTCLFTIAENIIYLIDYLNNVIDTIELQLEAYHNREKKPLYPNKADLDFINSECDFNGSFLKDRNSLNKAKQKMNENAKVKRQLDLIELRDKIKRYLVNQDEALRRVLVEIARMDIKENEKNKGVLLLGDTGTGKTFLMELLSRHLDVPFLIIDSTQLTIPGYVGKDIEEYLWELYEKCDKDLDKVERAIVFFDEIDKKGSNRKNDSSGQGVLNVLLKFLDGTTYDACSDVKHSSDKIKINTSKMKVFAGGAFSDIFKKDLKKRKIGFSSYEEDQEEDTSLEIPDIDVFVQKAFMTEEFMGRFPIRVRLKSHTVDSFSKILVESEDSTLKEEEKAFEKLGVILTATPEFVKAASERALKLKTGVRGLMGTVEEATWVAFEDVYNNPGKYEEIKLTEDCLTDPNNYQKVLKRKV